MKIAILGSGTVGEVLADGCLRHGHTVVRGSRDPDKLAAWASKSGGSAATFAAAVADAELVILAVKGSAAVEAIQLAGIDRLAGKVVIDATNPIADAPPVDGVIRFFTDLNRSLMEQLQDTAPAAHFVKAFSCVGNAFMVNPQLPGGPPTMFICGNDGAAKLVVRELLTQFGWDTEDLGTATAARAIEPLCMLWCIPGMRGGGWNHAFKLLRA